MNKADLIDKVADQAELSHRDAEAAVEALLDIVTKSLERGEVVKLSGFGIFEKKMRAAREGTNPATQAKIQIPESYSISFKVSKTLKEALNK